MNQATAIERRISPAGMIDKGEVKKLVEPILQHTVGNVRQYWPIRGDENNRRFDKFFSDLEALGLPKDYVLHRNERVGAASYDDRFVGSLIATALAGHNLDPLMAFPAENPHYLNVVKFLGENRSGLRALKVKWLEQRISHG